MVWRTIIMQVQSAFRYPGAKSKWAEDFLPQEFGLSLNEEATYVEPFIGGGSTLCAMLTVALPKQIVVNDICWPVYCFWLCISDPALTKKLVAAIEATTDVGLAEYRKQVRAQKSKSPVKAALGGLYANRTTIHGKLERDEADRLQLGVNGQTEDDIWPRELLVDRVLNLHESIGDRLVVHNEDFGTVMRRYDAPGALAYCDSPYYGSKFDTFYEHVFGDKEHRRLAATVRKMKHAQVLLSYNISDGLKQLYAPWAEVAEIEVPYSWGNLAKGGGSQQQTMGREFLIRNPHLVATRKREKRKGKARLRKVEATLGEAFLMQASAMKETNAYRLYRAAGYVSFEEYVKEEFDMSRSAAYRLIDAATLLENIAVSGTEQLPTRESWCRVLRLAGSAHRQREVWRAVVAKVEAGQKLSAKLIEATIREMYPKLLPASGAVPEAITAARVAATHLFRFDFAELPLEQQLDLLDEASPAALALTGLHEYAIRGDYTTAFVREAEGRGMEWAARYRTLTDEEHDARRKAAKRLREAIKKRQRSRDKEAK